MSGERSLSPCPRSPNCVSSQADDRGHRVEPFELKGSPREGWSLLRGVVESLPRTRIVESDERYLHAEARSRILGFVDDLELLLDADGVAQVRSASRLGYSDLGVNRARVEEIRAELRRRGATR